MRADTFANGQLVRDSVEGTVLVVIEDRDDRVLVSGTECLKPNPSLLDRAQWVLPKADLTPLEM